jgi:hypothetical protein
VSGASEGTALLRPEVTGALVNSELKTALFKLLSYCRSEDWAGYDPYDALNSAIFTKLQFLDSRFPRLALTQALKRSPINIRGLVRIPKTQNPKGLALFLSALLEMRPQDLPGRDELIEYMIARIGELRSKHDRYDCWGYSFPWQTRTLLVPRFAPNVVCTVFVAGSLLDAYEQRGGEQCLKMAVSAAEYILNDLYWAEGEAVGFCYPMPQCKSQTYNANLLAAALLCRVARFTNERKFVDPALRAARYAVSKQRDDGSWYYGETAKARWIDNFHTGYNLGALRSIGRELDSNEFEGSVRRGFEFYRANFFREDGAPKYFHNNVYPLDIHCVAQSILTLVAFKDLDSTNLEMANSVFDWAMKNMWDERGYFYYRVLRFGKVRTSYMRWSQAWMLLALSKLLACSDATASPVSAHSSTVLA